jgi:hypothetical protein
MQHEQPGFSIKDVTDIVSEIESFCEEAEGSAPVLTTLWDGWRRGLGEILEKTSQESPCSRVAVIGSIKSGKSTCVNALLGSDILRRGAGTLTSAVTRVIPSEDPRATITWKGWKKINAEAGFAAALLGGMTGAEGVPETLDLREEAHREKILGLLAEIGPSPAGFPRYALNQLSRLRALCSGYVKIHQHMKEETSTLVLEREWFPEHREIVTSDDTAAYVDDVLVEYAFPEQLARTEIADCQGSDSLNPSHLVNVQEYLLRADWTVYLVSSVMGLREADEKLLEVVKNLGLAENTVFILNTEIDTHASLEDLKRVQDTVEKFVGSRFGTPRLYTVSVLLELFETLDGRGHLSQREKQRLESWKKDLEMTGMLNARWQDLMTFWRDEISPAAGRFQRAFAQRSLANATTRLRQGLQIAANPYDIDLKALKVCAVEGERLLPNMESHLEGTAMKMDKLIRNKLDSLMDPSFSDLGKAVKEFIQGYSSQWDPTSTALSGSGTNIQGMILSLAEEFNQALHLFLADRVNTEIAHQTQILVERVQQEYADVLEMYQGVLNNNYLKMGQSRQLVSRHSAPGGEALPSGEPAGTMDVRELLDSPHVDLFSMKLELSLGQKALATARQGWMLSLKKAGGWASHRLFSKALEDDDEARAEVRLRWRDKTVKTLQKEGRTLMKKEMFRYRENLKYQVLIKYVRDLARASKDEMKERFEAFQGDMDHMREAPGISDKDVVAVRERLPEWEARLQKIEARILR